MSKLGDANPKTVTIVALDDYPFLGIKKGQGVKLNFSEADEWYYANKDGSGPTWDADQLQEEADAGYWHIVKDD